MLWSAEDEIKFHIWDVICGGLPDITGDIIELGNRCVLEGPELRRLALPAWIAILGNHRTREIALTLLLEERYASIKNWLIQILPLLDGLLMSPRTRECINEVLEEILDTSLSQNRH